MDVSVDIEIATDKSRVWQAIIDIDHCMKMIPSILAVDILSRPESGLVGLKWKETRLMFGKEASETMWITDALENEYYSTRAESHGSIYRTRLSLKEKGESRCILTMTFDGEAQSFLMKVLSVIMSPMMKGSMKKVLLKDLTDIKRYVEQQA